MTKNRFKPTFKSIAAMKSAKLSKCIKREFKDYNNTFESYYKNVSTRQLFYAKTFQHKIWKLKNIVADNFKGMILKEAFEVMSKFNYFAYLFTIIFENINR